MSPDDPRHGTNSGYDAHRAADTPTCERCLAAHRQYNRAQYAARTAERPRQLQYVDHDARREDVTFMADTGETYERAATRLGITVHAFEKWCDRHAPDLRARLRANERQSA